MGFNTHHEQTFHVLAVDDSLLDRKLLERLLTLSSYSVTCVESGDKALEYLGLLHDHDINHMPETKVNLIMTHYSMPGMTGYDLLKLVKKSSWKDVPVVVMSAENEPSRISIVLLQALLRNLFHHTPLLQTIREGRTLSEQIHLLIYEFDTKHIVLI